MIAAAPEAPAAAFYSFSDLVHLTAAAEGSRVVQTAIPRYEALDEDSASGGSSRQPDDSPAAAAGRALRVGVLGIGSAQAGVAPASAPRPQAYRFVVSALPEPQAWLLALAGLAVAGWVARRRLRFPILG